MENILEKTVQKYKESYEKIFTKFYPALGNNGFVERNQTNNFVNALISSLEDDNAFAWFEISLEKSENEKNKGHIDAVVFSPKHNSVFYVEAKRLSTYWGNFDKRVDSISADFNRILKKRKSILEPKEENLSKRKNFEVIDEYIICLADFWKSDHKIKFDDIKETWIKNMEYKDPIVFKSVDFEQGIFLNEAINKYNLLIAYTKIKM